MFNPNVKIAKGRGIDLPILKVYLAGRISGDKIEHCIKWRRDIILHYRNWEKTQTIECTNDENGFVAQVTHSDSEYNSYPIVFIDPLNSGEADSVDELGLTSNLSPNMIYDKDILSVERADVIVANMSDFMEIGIEDELKIHISNTAENEGTWIFDKNGIKLNNVNNAFIKLKHSILNRRPNLGTIEEVAIARYLRKPVILIVPENQLHIYEKHPFQGRASQIVTSVEQLLQEGHLEILYKSIAGATV